MAIWAADVCPRAARQLICIEPRGLRLRHIGRTDPQCGTVQFCFHSGRLTCSARTGFRAVTSHLVPTAHAPRDETESNRGRVTDLESAADKHGCRFAHLIPAQVENLNRVVRACVNILHIHRPVDLRPRRRGFNSRSAVLGKLFTHTHTHTRASVAERNSLMLAKRR